jgi:cytochrome c oxidase assembly protein subunit 11
MIQFQVDMPVFFYIDPEFAEDPAMEFIDSITLSYTFFESKEGMNLQMPSYAKPHS